jgi:hypothetical protein
MLNLCEIVDFLLVKYIKMNNVKEARGEGGSALCDPAATGRGGGLDRLAPRGP